MRLILFDCLTPKRINFHPLALSRPIFDLRYGMTTLAEKLVAKLGGGSAACFVPPYMAEAHRAMTGRAVNDPAMLNGDDLFLANARLRASELAVVPVGPSEVAVDADGEVLYARIARGDLNKLKTSSIDALLDSAKKILPRRQAAGRVELHLGLDRGQSGGIGG